MQFDDALQLGSRAIAARTQRCTYLRVNNLRKADEFVTVTLLVGDAVALLAVQRTCDSQVAGSTSGWAPLRNGLGQATYTHVPLSPSSIIWSVWLGRESNGGPGGK